MLDAPAGDQRENVPECCNADAVVIDDGSNAADPLNILF
jgi:hypothetical protein